MEWKDVDLAAREWRYFVTKTEVLNIVPLSRQVIEILQAIRPLTESGRYVFPSSRGDDRHDKDRVQHLDGRRKMMQAWADYLDALKA